jgi:integrase
VTTKTNAGERNIPLNQVSRLALDRLLQRAYKLGAEKPEHYLLPADLSRHTKPTDPLYGRRFDGFDPNLNQRSWVTSWGKLRAKAGLPNAQFYQLRHTSITAGAEENVPLAVMKALAGHMNERMTDYYTTVRDNPKAKAVAAIERANPELLSILGLGEDARDDLIN